MSGGDADFEAPITNRKQWVERQAGGGRVRLAKRKDQPGGDRIPPWGPSKSDVLAGELDEEAKMYEGVSPVEVREEASYPGERQPVRPAGGVDYGARNVRMGSGDAAEIPVSVAEQTAQPSVVSDPWEGLGSKDRTVPEGGQQAKRPGGGAKHFR